MMKSKAYSRLLMAAIVLLIVFAAGANAAVFMTFTVTTTGNSGTGTLRQAILNSNANPPGPGDHNLIVFAIPGTGPFTITPTTPEPDVLVPTEIDATTQPGFKFNTSANADNEKPMIVLSGASTTGVGLNLVADDCSVEGFVINGWSVAGIQIPGPGKGSTIRANFVGTNINATSAVPNNLGVSVAGSTNNLIGGDRNKDRNIASGNTASNICLKGTGSHDNAVFNNFIGVNAAGKGFIGTTALSLFISTPFNVIGSSGLDAGEDFHPGNFIGGGTTAGVNLNGSSAHDNCVEENQIGTDATGTIAIPNRDGVLIDANAHGNEIGENNEIAFNSRYGVNVSGLLTIDNTITQNSIHDNVAEGIELSLGNELIPAPILASAAHVCKGVGTQICGTFNDILEANEEITIEFFSNDICGPDDDSLQAGQGKTFIGSTTVTTNSIGQAGFNVILPIDVPSGKFITATATEEDGSTSEFSNCVQVFPKADLSIEKFVFPNPVRAGDAVFFVLKVKNNGPETAQNVVVTDNVPNSLMVAGCIASGGGSCMNVGNVVTATFPTIPSGATREVVILAFVGIDIVGAVNDEACVTGDVLDCNPLNDCSMVCLNVLPCTDRALLCARVMTGPLAVTPGQSGTWTFQVMLKACQTDLSNVKIIGKATGCRITACTAGTATTSGSSITWSIPKLVKGQSATMTVSTTQTIPKTAPADTFFQLSAPWTAGMAGGGCSPSTPVYVKVLGK